MRHPVEQRGCHLGIAKDGDPFTELQVGGDDDAIQWRQLPDDLPGIAFGLVPDQSVDQIDGIEEAGLFALIDQCGSQGNGDVGFACAGSAHQNEIVGFLRKLSGAEGGDPALGDGGGTIVKRGEVLVMRELCNPHLILDRTHLSLYSLGVEQSFYRSGQTWRLERGQQIMCANCHPMQAQGSQLVDQSVHTVPSCRAHSVS